MRAFVVVSLLALAVACAGPMRGSGGALCDALEGAGGLAVGQQPEPGRYTLRMRRLEGGSTAVASGQLTLLARDSANAQVRDLAGDAMPGLMQPLWGYTDAALGTVGAMFDGVATSRDRDRPGVVVDTQRGRDPESWSATMAFGSDSNRRDMIILDGAGTVATIARITSRGFAGTWRSYAGPTTYHMAGDFCAERRG